MEEHKMTRQELIDYFKDVFELESQLYTYSQIEPEYIEKLSYIGLSPNFRFVHTIRSSPQFMNTTKTFVLVDGFGDIIKVVERYSRNYNYENLRELVVDNGFEAVYRHRYESETPVIYSERFGFLKKPEWQKAPEFHNLIKRVPLPQTFFERLTRSQRYENKTNLDEVDKYFKKCLARANNEIIESEMPLRKHLENEYNEFVIKPKEEAKKLLDRLYSQNIIFPKYRHFACVAQIYEYLLSGRCDQLEGPYGAYNLYESELRQNIIIDRLDEIISQLGRLNSTMNTICGAIQETNSLLGKINSTLGRIEANTALTAYNSQCIAHNTRIASQYVL